MSQTPAQYIKYITKSVQTYKPDPDDSQQHRVYRLESCLRGGHSGHVAPRDFLRAALTRACVTWKLRGDKRPDLHFVHVNNQRYGWQDSNGITLNAKEDGQNLFTLLHELAHWICYVRDYAVEDHGPEWMWVYIELLDQFNVIPRSAMVHLCDLYQVEIG